MVFIQSLIQYLLLFLIFFGQLGRVNLLSNSFLLIDIALVGYTIFACYNGRLTKLPKLSTPLFIFLTYSWVNLIAQNYIFGHDLIYPAMYLLRLSCLLLMFIFPPLVTPKLSTAIFITIISNILFGLFQYFYWPDQTYMKTLGWDDHLNRLVGTYFDPTFTGLIYLIFLIWLYHRHQKITMFATYFALMLTYSRSTYLSLFGATAFYGLFSKKIIPIILSGLLIGLSIYSLPRKTGEGTKLERVSSINAKSVNFKEGMSLFNKYPLFGIGYNNISFYKNSPSNSHSIGGYDTSLLNILITGGIIGFVLFVYAYINLFISAPLIVQTMFAATLIHSLFANSLFYPHTSILVAFLYSLESKPRYHK